MSFAGTWSIELFETDDGVKTLPDSRIVARGHAIGIVSLSTEKDVRFRASSFLGIDSAV